METLFEVRFTNTQQLRSFEPLIRFDIDGRPQAKKPLNPDAVLKQLEIQKPQVKPSETPKQPTPEPVTVPKVQVVQESPKHSTEPKPEPPPNQSDQKSLPEDEEMDDGVVIVKKTPEEIAQAEVKPNDLKRKAPVTKATGPKPKKQSTLITSFFKKRE